MWSVALVPRFNVWGSDGVRRVRTDAAAGGFVTHQRAQAAAVASSGRRGRERES